MNTGVVSHSHRVTTTPAHRDTFTPLILLSEHERASRCAGVGASVRWEIKYISSGEENIHWSRENVLRKRGDLRVFISLLVLLGVWSVMYTYPGLSQ